MTHLRVLDLRGDRSPVADRLPRPKVDMHSARSVVADTIAMVRADGDGALRALTSRFDAVDLDEIRVPVAVLDAALAQLPSELRSALEQAAEQVRSFHERARPTDWEDVSDGRRMGVRHHPVARAGVYVPGGKAVYPSTVVMTVVPAQVAGVTEIILCTPPTGGDGLPNRTILAAAAMLGVTDVFAVGGAQAIAAMALGTESIPSCDMVVGPGNVYVAIAKQTLAAEGVMGTDGYAGPTEIAIIADDTAEAALVAADLVAQAEHDEMATCVLITTSPELLDGVQSALDEQVSATRHSSRVAVALAGQGTAVLVDDLDHAVDVAEAFAAEHLEIHTRDAAQLAVRVRWAGTIFVGSTTPVSLGDYAAGPNHTLPTSGTARFAGGLTTSSFLVPVNHVEYDQQALRALAPSVLALAEAEDLPAHGQAVQIRLEAAP